MKIGLISDVHANLPALEAVLADLPPVDRLVCLGDVVGYNPFPKECLDLVRAECDLIVQGNHDRDVADPESHGSTDAARRGLELARERLPDADLAYLQGLPVRAEVGTTGILAVHSHPTTTDAYVQPEDVADAWAHVSDRRGLVLGHTHVQHEQRIGDGLVVNPGSVGQPRDGDVRAASAVLDTETLETDLRRVDYDVHETVAAIRSAGLPERTAERLLPGPVGPERDRHPWRRD